jgi:hypothetical protein
MQSQELPVEVKVETEPKPRKRSRWRLRVLLAFGVFAFALYVISQLEPDQAKRCGPIIESAYLVFHPPIEVPLSEAGKQFIDEIAAMGGTAGRIEPQRRFFGLMRAHESFVVGFSDVKFDDAALERLATNHGDHIAALNLMDTGVTDDGLKHLKRFGNLNSLFLASSSPRWVNGKRLTPITDAGMANLDLPTVVNLSLDGLPITDAGLELLPYMPSLRSLQMTGTQIKGPGLSRLAALRNLQTLLLNGGAVTDEGLAHLAGAKSLMILSLDGMPLSGAGLKHVITLPRLGYVAIRGCQVPYEDVEEIRAKLPSLRIER